MKTAKYLVVLLITVVSACSHQEELLHGQWRGVAATQAGDSLQLNAHEIYFDFQEDGIYHYQSTLNYQEAGTYTINGKQLTATDTTHTGSAERKVAIELITADSLRIRWLQNGAEQLISFIRE